MEQSWQPKLVTGALDAEIDLLLEELEKLGVNCNQFRTARSHMAKEQLKTTLTQILEAHVTQGVLKEQLSDKLVCPKCGRSRIADKSLILWGFCDKCGSTMNFERAV